MVDLIKRHEGYRQYPYKCTAGALTCAYGRNLDAVGISEDEAEVLLNNDIVRAEEDLTKVFDSDFLYESGDLSYNRYSVLVNMMFNLGLTRFKGFKKMIQAVKDQDFDEAAREMLDSRWAKQVKQRAYELALMMEAG
jgi:lysozyme